MLHYIILGIIEGFTEFLPISSTAHLILYNYISGFDLSNNFLKAFNISIQLGAILSVIIYYFKELTDKVIIKSLFLGVIPTLIIGFIFKDIVSILMEYVWLIAMNLIIGGIIIIAAEHYYKNNRNNRIESINNNEAVKLGFIQSIAMLPGVSRSGALIVYGLYRNIRREVIAKYTFLLAVPTMIAATGYSILKYRHDVFDGNLEYLIVGFVTSFIVALLIVKYALPFIRKYSFTPFAIYRIILGIIILLNL